MDWVVRGLDGRRVGQQLAFFKGHLISPSTKPGLEGAFAVLMEQSVGTETRLVGELAGGMHGWPR